MASRKLQYCRKCFTMYAGPPVASFCGCKKINSRPGYNRMRAVVGKYYELCEDDLKTGNPRSADNRLKAAHNIIKEQDHWENWQKINNPYFENGMVDKAIENVIVEFSQV